jgi:hypothetical protein
VPPPAERPSYEPGNLRCRCGAPVCDAGRPWPLAASPKGQNGPENGPFWSDGPAKQSYTRWPSSTSHSPIASLVAAARSLAARRPDCWRTRGTSGARRREPRVAAQARPIGRCASALARTYLHESDHTCIQYNTTCLISYVVVDNEKGRENTRIAHFINRPCKLKDS